MRPYSPELDFLAKPARPWLGWIALVVMSGALGALVLAWNQRNVDLNGLSARLFRLEQSMPSASMRPTSSPVPAERLAIVQRDLHRPWPGLLNAIEAAHRAPVQLLTIEPDAQSGKVLVSGVTKRFSEITDYVRALSQQTLFEVTLLSHLKPVEPPGQPFRFVIAARWHNGADAAPISANSSADLRAQWSDANPGTRTP